MRTFIGGSRSIIDPGALQAAIEASTWTITEIITGTSRGTDALVLAWAERMKIPCTAIAADWARFGGRAELLRSEMILPMVEGCILLWDGFSTGTATMMASAKKRGIPVVVHRVNPQSTSR
jgi:hypothetical protein